MNYDFIIIGAGIAGCSIAHHLHVRGKKVLLVDEIGIASHASKAAGAFLSPLQGKINSYNSLVNTSLLYSLKFYESIDANLIVKKGLLKVAKNEKEYQQLKESATHYLNINQLQNISTNFHNIEGEYSENAAIVEPVKIAQAMTKGIDTLFGISVKALTYSNDVYTIDSHTSKHIILSTGAHKALIECPYIDIIPAHGVRIEATSSTPIPFNIHRKFSLSTQRHNGTIAIGATNSKRLYKSDVEQADIESLLEEVKEYMKLEDLEIKEVYQGARATIKSYFPVIGPLINSKETLRAFPSIMKGTKIPEENLIYHPNITLFNAVGSRGFVFSPYLAKLLTEYLLDGIALPSEVQPLKLFYKYARSEPNII